MLQSRSFGFNVAPGGAAPCQAADGFAAQEDHIHTRDIGQAEQRVVGQSTAAGSKKQGSYEGKSVEVGTFPPNPYGLHDMEGNVFEWVEDCWNDNFKGAPADGTAWLTGDCSIRVQRGGAWGYPPDYLRTAVRGRQEHGYRYINAGLRAARTLGP